MCLCSNSVEAPGGAVFFPPSLLFLRTLYSPTRLSYSKSSTFASILRYAGRLSENGGLVLNPARSFPPVAYPSLNRLDPPASRLSSSTLALSPSSSRPASWAGPCRETIVLVNKNRQQRPMRLVRKYWDMRRPYSTYPRAYLKFITTTRLNRLKD